MTQKTPPAAINGAEAVLRMPPPLPDSTRTMAGVGAIGDGVGLLGMSTLMLPSELNCRTGGGKITYSNMKSKVINDASNYNININRTVDSRSTLHELKRFPPTKARLVSKIDELKAVVS